MLEIIPIKKYRNSLYNSEKIINVYVTVDGLVLIETAQGIFKSSKHYNSLACFEYEDPIYLDSVLCAIQDDRSIEVNK